MTQPGRWLTQTRDGGGNLRPEERRLCGRVHRLDSGAAHRCDSQYARRGMVGPPTGRVCPARLLPRGHGREAATAAGLLDRQRPVSQPSPRP
jgi:hypothetical protein